MDEVDGEFIEICCPICEELLEINASWDTFSIECPRCCHEITEKDKITEL